MPNANHRWSRHRQNREAFAPRAGSMEEAADTAREANVLVSMSRSGLSR